MPTAELSRRRRDAPEPSRTRAAENDQFDFPTNHHLLVTTASHVLCWNREGLRPIFKSGSAGIAAARESRDGSRKLAVADGRNVLMHEVERGMEGTYRLKGAEVCHCTAYRKVKNLGPDGVMNRAKSDSLNLHRTQRRYFSRQICQTRCSYTGRRRRVHWIRCTLIHLRLRSLQSVRPAIFLYRHPSDQ